MVERVVVKVMMALVDFAKVRMVKIVFTWEKVYMQ